MLLLENNKEWRRLGGKLILPVHDELIAEVPIQNWKRGGELLSALMCKAADYLPFPSKCDVTTTLRWYGLEYPCQYIEPTSVSNLNELPEDEIKWVQYMLTECEYSLPVIPNEDGSDLRGDATVGINGKITPEYEDAITQYCQKYQIEDSEQFIKHIKQKVIYGTTK